MFPSFISFITLHIQDAIVVKSSVNIAPHVIDPENNTEIVIVSDTVRQRRARTPLSSEINDKEAQPEILNKEPICNVLPDLLPTTFRLAESSTLFSQISDKKPNDYADMAENGEYAKTFENEPNTTEFSVVEIREANLTPKMSVKNFTVLNPEDDMKLAPQNGAVVNTISILETVDTFEPEFVETVHIIDASENSSDSSPDDLDEELERESTAFMQSIASPNDTSCSVIVVQKQKLDTPESHHRLYKKERDPLSDYDHDSKRMRKYAPNVKQHLRTQERDSFYNSDQDNQNDEPLEFSEDEDIPRFSLEMTPDVDSDSDTVYPKKYLIFF